MKIEDIEKRSLEYAEITAPTYANGDFESTIADAFEHGANWRINSVWHSYKIKPDKGKLLLVEDIDSAYDLVYLNNSNPWEELSKKSHYMRWAYVEDLLPNKQEK